MKTCRLLAYSALSLLWNLGTTLGQVQYTVTGIGTLPGYSYATNLGGINNGGQVVGWGSASSGGIDHAFLYSGGSMQDLGVLGGVSGKASHINASGVIVGEFQVSLSNGLTHGLIDSGGTVQDINSGFVSSVARAINDIGQVAGTGQNSNGTNQAFLYSNGTMQLFGSLFGSNSISGADAINNYGVVTGRGGADNNHLYAFIISNGTLRSLGTLPNYTFTSEGTAINDSGKVVGVSDNASGFGHSFLYSNGTMSDLGTLPGYGLETAAADINSSGLVVGYGENATYQTHAFIYSNGSMTDLNSLISPTSGWTLENAVAINNSGQIIGEGTSPGGQTSVFLLTPAPEPGTFALLAIFLIGVIGCHLQRRGANALSSIH